jgi:hypothetical protein
VLAGLGSFGAGVACVTGGAVTINVAPDADAMAADETEADASPEVSASDGTCGSPPWVDLGLLVTRFELGSDAGTPLPGAVFAPSICPGFVGTSDDAGLISGQISKDVPFTASLTATGFISELTPEQAFDAASTSSLEMLPTLFAALVPGDGGLTPQSTVIILSVDQPLADAGPCSTTDGVSFSVPGHPEATVTYFSSGPIPSPAPGATATTAAGLALITGLPSGRFVSPVGTKSGCTVSLAHGNQTGRVFVQNGFASLASAALGP